MRPRNCRRMPKRPPPLTASCMGSCFGQDGFQSSCVQSLNGVHDCLSVLADCKPHQIIWRITRRVKHRHGSARNTCRLNQCLDELHVSEARGREVGDDEVTAARGGDGEAQLRERIAQHLCGLRHSLRCVVKGPIFGFESLCHAVLEWCWGAKGTVSMHNPQRADELLRAGHPSHSPPGEAEHFRGGSECDGALPHALHLRQLDMPLVPREHLPLVCVIRDHNDIVLLGLSCNDVHLFLVHHVSGGVVR
mmetsp:Transcript_7460/g.13458  ORF Transcript_7460/g.13458 Transcript_7460/m.13458 type:complete len:249 (-) Transcript_7460:722-1468(-)